MGQEYDSRVIPLETRIQRLEAMMQALLIRLGVDPAEVTPQEPPEDRAIWEALLSGNKIKAIQIYREVYGVGLKAAKDAIDAMEKNQYR